MPPHHLYIHVPFCRLVCAYCDFVTVAGRRTDVPRYVDALLTEMRARPARGTLRTIYFGGGTPSVLSADQVERLVQAAVDAWQGAPVEVSLEANPSAREAPDWAGLRAAGVTRISLGVQSLRDEDLRALARGHTAAEAVTAFRDVRRARFASVSLDLMYGIPGQTLDGWKDVIRRALALEPDHVSLYGLSLALRPDEWAAAPRPGALRWRLRAAAAQDDDLAARQYEIADHLLTDAGLRQYELSSWAVPGHECTHNRAYWERLPYTGIGAGAHSFDGSVRRWNLRELDTYLVAVERGTNPVEGREALDDEIGAFETLALALRMVEGLSRVAFARRFGDDPVVRYAAAVRDTARLGLVEVTQDRLRLTQAGRLLANEALIAFAP